MIKFQTFSSKIRSAWSEIPKPILKFALKGLIIFIIWQIIYTNFLKPNRILDKPITFLIGNSTILLLQKTYSTDTFYIREIKYFNADIEFFESSKAVIYKNNFKLIGIGDSCNGLEMYILYIAFIFIFPSRLKNKINYILFGIPIIIFSNIIRCYGLCIVQLYSPHFFVYAHHYIFKIITYFVVFFLWIKFAKTT